MTQEEIRLIIKEAGALNKQGQYALAEQRANEALLTLDTYSEHHAVELRVKALTVLAKAQQSLKQFPSALNHLLNALSIAEAAENQKLIADVCGSIGVQYYHASDFVNAVLYMQRALGISEELNLQAGIAKNLTNIAIVYTMIADYPKALEYHQRAKGIYEAQGNTSGIKKNLDNTGVVYSQLGDHKQAIFYYEKALKQSEELGDELGMVTVLSNMSISYHQLKEYETALVYFKQGLAKAEKRNLKTEVGKFYGNMGNTYAQMKQFAAAKENMVLALQYAQETHDAYQCIHWVMGLGQIYAEPVFEEHNEELAVSYLKKAIEDSMASGLLKIVADAHFSLYKIYKRAGDWQQSLQQMEKMLEVREKMNLEESTKRAQLLEHNRRIEEGERNRQVKLARFQEQEKILHNILPSQIAERILEGEKNIADYCDGVSVFFSDIVGFTKLSQHISPQQLVTMLNNLFSAFDKLAKKHGLEKIKTIGDAYMAVAGVPLPQADHAERAARFALDVKAAMYKHAMHSGEPLQIRIGLHTGHAVAGIIGETKFAYDLWGDAVNTASRMESHGEPGKIHVSEDFYKALQGSALHFVERGEMEVKGKGVMKTYFLISN